jgi:TRAP-type C4-dicarboxylate transport system permease small subunit
MQRGAVTCFVGGGFWLKQYGLADVAKYVVDRPLGQYNNGSVLTINQGVWKGLSAEHKRAILEDMPFLLRRAAQANIEQDREAREASKAKGVAWAQPSAEFNAVFAKFREGERPRVIKAATDKGIPNAEAIYKKFDENLAKWTRIVAETGDDWNRYEEGPAARNLRQVPTGQLTARGAGCRRRVASGRAAARSGPPALRQRAKAMTRLLKALDRIADLLVIAGCAVTLAMMLHVTADVLGKVLFNHPINGTLEVVTYYYMVGCVFLPLAMVQRKRAQIVVEVFTHLLPRRALLYLDGVVSLVSAGFAGLLTYHGALHATAKTQLREVIPSPQLYLEIWPARWFVVLGTGAVTLYLVVQAVRDLLEATRGADMQARPELAVGSGIPIA